jgi:hypothetical protein
MVTDHTKSGIYLGFLPLGYMLIVVEMKFTAPRMGDTPTKCREKIARSLLMPWWCNSSCERRINCSSCSCTNFFCSAGE